MGPLLILWALVIVLLIAFAGCAPKPFAVCDDVGTCRAVDHAGASNAADVHKEWGKDSTLKLRISKETR